MSLLVKLKSNGFAAAARLSRSLTRLTSPHVCKYRRVKLAMALTKRALFKGVLFKWVESRLNHTCRWKGRFSG